MLLRLQSRCQRTLARRLGCRRTRIHLDHPIVSFTFDDFPRSALLTAGVILEDHGAAGTYYLSLGLMNGTAPTGEIFHQEDLQRLISGGHELGCHTFSHCDSWNTPPREFEASVQENRTALARLLPGTPLPTLSYPISCPRPGTKRRLEKYFACCRGGGQTFNHGFVDANYLSAFFIEQSRAEPKRIYELIEESCRANGWLIFATHDVNPHPTPYGCTPELFTRIVERCQEGGARVLPVSKVWQQLTSLDP